MLLLLLLCRIKPKSGVNTDDNLAYGVADGVPDEVAVVSQSAPVEQEEDVYEQVPI